MNKTEAISFFQACWQKFTWLLETKLRVKDEKQFNLRKS